MSTRCQVKVTQEGMGDWKDEITLYHHCDGYPTNMLALFKEAWDIATKQNQRWNKDTVGPGWEAGRAGKVASFICASDPGQFEPEAGHELHSDIEWYYVLSAVNEKSGSVDDNPVWKIKVYIPGEGFWDNSAEDNMILVAEGTLSALLKERRQIEETPSDGQKMARFSKETRERIAAFKAESEAKADEPFKKGRRVILFDENEDKNAKTS